MTDVEKVRNNIDDHIQIGFAEEQSDGNMKVYQLNARNYWDLTVTSIPDESPSEPVEIDSEDYEEFPMAGQIKAEIAAGVVKFEYKHAGFKDSEITSYIEDEGSINKASLKCIKILLASAAKRFDYKAGIKDIKASQVFDHLKQLKEDFEKEVESEDNSTLSSGVFAKREHPAYSVNLKQDNKDVSRSDS